MEALPLRRACSRYRWTATYRRPLVPRSGDLAGPRRPAAIPLDGQIEYRVQHLYVANPSGRQELGKRTFPTKSRHRVDLVYQHLSVRDEEVDAGHVGALDEIEDLGRELANSLERVPCESGWHKQVTSPAVFDLVAAPIRSAHDLAGSEGSGPAVADNRAFNLHASYRGLGDCHRPILEGAAQSIGQLGPDADL